MVKQKTNSTKVRGFWVYPLMDHLEWASSMWDTMGFDYLREIDRKGVFIWPLDVSMDGLEKQLMDYDLHFVASEREI